ncbi:unnamed protein product [Linum trigynum]|uniref:Uncharacterized protein n=1 Tax=Linum trigynum TaxID=586398 RepID=A0AAV2DFX8_9ROSI
MGFWRQHLQSSTGLSNRSTGVGALQPIPQQQLTLPLIPSRLCFSFVDRPTYCAGSNSLGHGGVAFRYFRPLLFHFTFASFNGGTCLVSTSEKFSFDGL